MKIILTDSETGLNPTIDELAKTILDRLGLEPRKRGSTDQMSKTLLELYERTKIANREKKPELAIVTVEEMAEQAGITRQTMYEYLKRWIGLNIVVKSSFITAGRVVIGYKLNGPNVESAIERAVQRINNNLDATLRYARELQRIIKNEKIKKSQKKGLDSTQHEMFKQKQDDEIF